MKYLAIKVKGMNHWLWFASENIDEKDGVFIGTGGWGKGGAFTSCKVSSLLIEGRIESESLQYV